MPKAPGKRVKKFFICSLVFSLIFFIFIYFFSPYIIFKNYLISKIDLELNQSDSPINFHIKTVRPYLLSGVKLNEVSIQGLYPDSRKPLKIDTAKLRFVLLPLFTGRIAVKADILLPEGEGSFYLSFPIFSFLKGNLEHFLFKGTFKHFKIDGFIDQFLNMLEESNDPNISLILPMITQASIGGFLDGHFYLNSNKEKIGFVNLNMEEFYLSTHGPALNIPYQHFKQAKIDITWDGQTYTINKDTTFESENLFLNSKGYIESVAREPLLPPMINLDLLLIVSGDIEKNFGFLIPQLLRCPSASMVDGVMNVKLFGPISQYICQ